MHTCGLVILAAGSSSRLGTPKQLLPYKGISLLQHVVQEAQEAVPEPVVVVLGAGAPLLYPLLDGDINIVHNPGWEEGMASSIRCGLAALQDMAPSLNCAIFMVCDQPYISRSLIGEMILRHRQTGKGIIACEYDGTTGTPVLFGSQFFPELLQLNGKEGAKKLIKLHAGAVDTVHFPMGHIDIDTVADYEALRKDE